MVERSRAKAVGPPGAAVMGVSGVGEALPLKPHMFLEADGAERSLHIRFDPRILVEPEGAKVLNPIMNEQSYRLVHENALRDLAVRLTGAIHELYHRGQVAVVELWPQRPKWKHDCEACCYLGTHFDHDLYFCRQVGGVDTLIARYGSEGAEYKSGVGFAELDADIWGAAVLAQGRGLTRVLSRQHTIIYHNRRI